MEVEAYFPKTRNGGHRKAHVPRRLTRPGLVTFSPLLNHENRYWARNGMFGVEMLIITSAQELSFRETESHILTLVLCKCTSFWPKTLLPFITSWLIHYLLLSSCTCLILPKEQFHIPGLGVLRQKKFHLSSYKYFSHYITSSAYLSVRHLTCTKPESLLILFSNISPS